jgi:hypothetical protein
MKSRSLSAATGVALLIAGLGSTAAYAADPGDSGSGTIIVSGHELGPDDGLTVVEESFPIVRGGDPVGVTFDTKPSGELSTQEVWGSSYAFSQEQAYVSYIGHAKAAANVHQGLRIVRVCFWWTQASRTSATTCANATFSGGSWTASPEVSSTFNDSLDSNAPQTVFHIQTSRIDPRG